MKKHIAILCMSVLAFSSYSDFLDVQPEGNATIDNYFTNDQQARRLMRLTRYTPISNRRAVTDVSCFGNKEPLTTSYGDVLVVITR